MKTRQTKLIDALCDPKTQYVVPVYQRVYSWTQPHCEALLRDSLAAAVEDKEHFVGTVLYRPAAEKDGVLPLTLIDGQQRLATVALLAAAIRDAKRDLEGGLPEWLDRCISVEMEDGPQPKVILSRPDRPTFAAVMLNRELPDEESQSELVLENLAYFEAVLAEPDFDIDLLLQGLEKLTIVEAELDGNDRPQLVFESLNAKGMPLKTSDLIRNLLLTQLDFEEQVRLFKKYWEPLEDRFDAIEEAEKAERKSKIGIPPSDRRVEWEGLALDAALHGWLVENSPTARPSTRAGLYDAFKNHVAENPEMTLEELLTSINVYCNRFADEFESDEAKEHINWAIGKPEGFGFGGR
uniref:GmrSD restriction endonucleases N-terminal domain-containing protein n=1 Tax=uncultured bacterium Contig1772 TaxID=1393512 RepID=W0FJW4_9BACT|nr:hypothetical protein [uncultured bacterium Contig1772]